MKAAVVMWLAVAIVTGGGKGAGRWRRETKNTEYQSIKSEQNPKQIKASNQTLKKT